MSTVLVASGGGHLMQMLSLVPRMRLPEPIVWATPDTGLSRDRLSPSELHVIPYLPARDWKGALGLVKRARAILTETGAERIISTGAAPAPPFFLVGAAMGLDLHYIETATRSNGPSVSGKLVSKIPSAHLYTQYPHLADERWRFAGSIFDPFEAVPSQRPQAPITKVVVSLGTEKFGFRRAVEALLQVLPAEAEVLWQTGLTDVSGLPITGHPTIPSGELRAAIAEADVVVSHSGTGSALTAFELGKVPVLLPREARFGEHIDDHQALTAMEMTRRGLAVATPVDQLSMDALVAAASSRVVTDGIFRPFDLVGVEAAVPEVIDLRDPAYEASSSRKE